MKIITHGSEAGEALARLRNYDTANLVREAELGSRYALREIVEPANRVIALFNLIVPEDASYLPKQQQSQLKDEASAFYNLLEEAKNFDIDDAQPTPADAKIALIDRFESYYQNVYNAIHPFISFVGARQRDFSRLETEARAATQTAKDQAAELLKKIEEDQSTISQLLDDARSMAAEQGVSKQAIHFKTEADTHHNLAFRWLKYTIISAILLGLYSIGSLFIHNVPGTMSGTYGALQLAVSKALIFAVIAYMVFLCSRNFLSHKHNEIVNRHRQNALATFTALADATSNSASSDVVLNHAAACIFGPQDTGYTKSNGSQSEQMPGLQIFPRLAEGSSG